jgi:dTMP kinase
MFVTFEGIEGCGKSTQARLFRDALGGNAVLTREPGGTELGRRVRSLVLDHVDDPPSTRTELLLFFADRAHHVAQVIRPALERGIAVVCDRYVDSTLAYQGYGRGVPLADIRALAAIATGGLVPDLTVLLDIPVALGLSRAALRTGGHDRLESEAVAFHERVRAGYLEMAAAEPQRYVLIDGAGTPGEVAVRVRATAVPRAMPHVR